MEYVELESEKYWRQDLERKAAQIHKHRNRKAARDFVTFVGGIALIPACMLLAYKLPFWFPGLAAVLQSWMDQFLPAQIADSIAQIAS